MDTNRLLNTVGFAGKLLIQSGAEIYRVEETMVRLCKSFVEVQDADSFVTPTGIMFSITVNDQTFTKIMRVHSRSVDLNCIDKINALSRKASVTPYTLEELETELDEIRKQTRYSFLVTMLFGAIGAAGFAIFLMAHGKKLFVPLLLEFSLNVFAGA
ncbi:threonine/serine exporter family protein [Amedibacterium intestinale]|uniref:threonine/serine exporter family protein n=1 Tax=Amedibacterium intestinale TaxID=2583452 RepID=UPI0022E45705|nr:threonine/serine exporter family protein [Amedibacterium intestinale]